MSLNIDKIILSGGLIAIGATVFAESGLLIGFFLPGDTLLFGAGILASQGTLPLVPLLFITVLAAVTGDNVGYSIGRRAGPKLFKKKDSLLFKHEHIAKAEEFYEKHGGKTIIFARFIPIVRTFAPMVAGIGKMPRGRFMLFNVVGGVAWGAGVTLLGYWFGSKVPWIEHYITPVILGIVIISIGASLVHIFKDADNRKILLRRTKNLLGKIFLNKRVE